MTTKKLLPIKKRLLAHIFKKMTTVRCALTAAPDDIRVTSAEYQSSQEYLRVKIRILGNTNT